jgi:BNR/Asp-box repeat protein
MTTATTTLYAATGGALVRIQDGAVDDLGAPARCVAVGPDGAVHAGGGEGVGSLVADVFSVAVGPDGAVYAGTEPSELHVSRDGGETWEERAALQDIPSKPTWSFPPRPWTSHVRWIAPSPHEAELLLVGIELGGVMRTTDGGATFSDHRPGAQLDCHCLAWHPTEPGRAYQAAGGGAAWSADGGETWEPADAGRDRNYCWALAVDPGDPDTWWCSASPGPFQAHGGRDAQARIYRWADGAWHALTDLLTAMPYALLARDGVLYAGFNDGQLKASEDGGDTWEDVAFLPAITALAA